MIEVVCGVIRNGEGSFLACRRAPGRHLGGLWEFPGGKIEPGERPEEALRRELAEELGIGVAVGAALQPVIWDYGKGAILLRPFFCAVESGEPCALEHAEIRWCAAEELGDLEWAEADLPVIGEILSATPG